MTRTDLWPARFFGDLSGILLRKKKDLDSKVRATVFIFGLFNPDSNPREHGYKAMGRSSGSRITLLAEPSHPFGQWHADGFRPRSQRRVRNGFQPFSLMPFLRDTHSLQ